MSIINTNATTNVANSANSAKTIADLVKELQVHVMEIKSMLNDHTVQLNKLCDPVNPSSLEYQLTLATINHKMDVLMSTNKTAKAPTTKKDSTATAGAESNGTNVRFYPNAEFWGQEMYATDPEFAVNLFTADEIVAAEKDPSVTKKKAARAKSDAVFNYLYVNTNEDTRAKITELFNNSGSAEPAPTEETPVDTAKPAAAKKVTAKGKSKAVVVDEPIVNDTVGNTVGNTVGITNTVSLFNGDDASASATTTTTGKGKGKGKTAAK